jgi:hypothetical protein
MNENKIERQTFTYPLFFGLLYRYGNIVVTFLLVVYSLPLIVTLDKNELYIIPLLISLLIIYYLNKHYLNLYKILPYKIEADDEKIICEKFFLSKKSFTIYYKDIESLKGGIFENKLSGVMKVYDGKNSIAFGFYTNLQNSNKLVTIILSKVKRSLYDEVLGKIASGKKGK